MICDHYNLTSHPFDEHTDPQRCVCDYRTENGLKKLNIFQTLGPIGVLIGRTGIGKTMLIRKWMMEISLAKDYQCFYIHLTNPKPVGLLRQIVSIIGEKPKMGKDRMMKQIIDFSYHQRRAVILIIDEAHLLSEESLIDFRMLTCSIDTRDNVRVLLVGQDPLKSTLRRECLRDLKERVCISFQLKPMDELQTNRYIDERMDNAGGKKSTFDDSARQLLFYHSQGVPRRVNHYATKCLLIAMDNGQKKVDEKTARESLKEIL